MIAAIALAAAVTSATQMSGALPGGGQYILHRDATAGTAAVELWYRVPSAGYDNANPGIARLALAALAVSAPPHGTSFAELVKRDGGSLTINVYADIAMVGASVPAAQAPAVLKALTSTYFAPSISDAGLKAALRDSAIVATEEQYDADQQLQNALFARLFSAGPAHYAPVPPSAAAFAKIPVNDIRAFAARGFRQSNAVLSIAGNVDPEVVGNARTSMGAQAQGDAPFDSSVAQAPGEGTASAAVTGIGFGWIGPPISDVKAATAMDFIADYLFDGNYGTIAHGLSAANGDVYASGQFITLHNPGVLIATIGGSGSDAIRAAVEKAVDAMHSPLDAKTFEAARNAFVYHILAQSQTPVSHADNAGWYAVEGNPGYAPGDESREYLQAVQSLDPGYVASVAAKFLGKPVVVQLLAAPRGGSTT